MRHTVGSIGLLLVAAVLGGCSSSPQPKLSTPADVFAAMDDELAHSIEGKADGFDAMHAELSHAIGTTMLTSATLAAPAPLPIDEELEPTPVLQTWGVASAD